MFCSSRSMGIFLWLSPRRPNSIVKILAIFWQQAQLTSIKIGVRCPLRVRSGPSSAEGLRPLSANSGLGT
jgi:hypothetical protein